MQRVCSRRGCILVMMTSGTRTPAGGLGALLSDAPEGKACHGKTDGGRSTMDEHTKKLIPYAAKLTGWCFTRFAATGTLSSGVAHSKASRTSRSHGRRSCRCASDESALSEGPLQTLGRYGGRRCRRQPPAWRRIAARRLSSLRQRSRDPSTPLSED